MRALAILSSECSPDGSALKLGAVRNGLSNLFLLSKR
ncbi:hypothetical protein FHX49_000150 [Microbacterium endophyticum]|uniref:Uncharacterized protein n=1 Tax=Microbacterium endophyticum TaxID=1526412 RepID=A0A7W4V0Q3_9MICO|nr:hypothetical protein [Microbacterium endophyticum]NIK36906.1 hypothetical protein [Microbacterium endophyticum]